VHPPGRSTPEDNFEIFRQYVSVNVRRAQHSSHASSAFFTVLETAVFTYRRQAFSIVK
jgi:hypothetical protein